MDPQVLLAPRLVVTPADEASELNQDPLSEPAGRPAPYRARSEGIAELSAAERTCQVPVALARSITAWPREVIRPRAVILVARYRFTLLQVLRGRRGVNRKTKLSAPCRRAWLSIQP